MDGGDLWEWTESGGLKQLTYVGSNLNPVISPDGKWVAYSSVGQVYAEHAIKDGDWGGQLPMNIWLLNVATGKSFIVADEPSNARYQTDSYGVQQLSAYILRSQPIWSPDSMKIAWTEDLFSQTSTHSQGSRSEKLVVYDLSTRSTRVIVANMPYYSVGPTQPAWGSEGIAVFTNIARGVPGTITWTTQANVYDMNGKQLSSVKVGDDDYLKGWVNDGNNPYLLEESGVIDPKTGAPVYLGGPPELYSLDAPGGMGLIEDQDSTKLTVPDKPPQSLGQVFGAAIAPDGQQAAVFTSPDLMHVDSDGGLTRIDVNGPYWYFCGTTWSATGWRIRHN